MHNVSAGRVSGGGLGSRTSLCGSRSLFGLLISFFLARTALSFAPGHLWRARRGAFPVLRALAGAAYDDGFITTLSSELCLQPTTVNALRHNRATELAIVLSSREELQKFFNITSISDAIAISSWSEIKRKKKEEAEQARRKKKEEAEQALRKKEEEAEQARRKQQKLDEAKLVFIFNEVSRKYEKYHFQDQNSLQIFISNDRIRGLAVVEGNDSYNEVIIDWARLVNGSYYSAPEKKEDAVKVLMDKSAKDEKAKAEYGCSRMLSDYYCTELVYIDSDIKLKDKHGSDLGDIDSLFISKNGSQVVLLERKSSLSADSVADLIEQVFATKKAFVDPDTRFSIPFRRGENCTLNPSIISAVYCKTGPVSLFQNLTAQGIHVVVDSVQHFAPILFDEVSKEHHESPSDTQF